MEQLLDLKTGRLLNKFGAGNHKPGSGSAAALQGMLSAQLIRTVIALTNDEKRRQNYKEELPELLKIDEEIKSRIYPELERLFQEDSVQFDKAIKLRQDRDKEEDLIQKSQLAIQTLRELKPATEIPIEIAGLCIELAEFAAFVFDHAFKSARGDSCVALNGAVSAIAGCLSIIDLNLLSFTNDQWTKKIRYEADRLRSHYKSALSKMIDRQTILKREADQTELFYSDINALRSNIQAKSKLSNLDIEDIVTQLQNMVWKYRRVIWKKGMIENPMDVLKPEVALKKLGYQFCRDTTLGQNDVRGNLFEVAGQIDKQNKFVAISEQFPPDTQNFTTAHELGHALLHKQSVLHRDRALDGSPLPGPRSLQELQADKFATYFLMPKKQVKRVFKDLFLVEKFIINEDTAFALNEANVDTFREKCRNLRGLARILASTEYFNGRPFYSISKQFHVSIEAMAIRLEELELLEF